MRALLKLFLVPYLLFLGKVQVAALCLLGFAFFLNEKESYFFLMVGYALVLILTTGRHQFRSNIPWMLASFNKRTLAVYHFAAQAFILLCLGASAWGFRAAYHAGLKFFHPNDYFELVREAQHSSFLERTETGVILAILASVLVGAIFSPVTLRVFMQSRVVRARSVKDMLLATLALGVGFGICVFVDFDHYTLLIHAGLLVAFWVGWLRGSGEVFVVPTLTRARNLVALGVVATAFLTWGVRSQALHRFQSGTNAGLRLAELDYLGAFGPALSSAAFTEFASQLKAPSDHRDVMDNERFAELIDPREVRKWVLASSRFRDAVHLVEKLPSRHLEGVLDRQTWARLDQLHGEFAKSDPQWAKSVVKDLATRLRRQKYPLHLHAAYAFPVEQLLAAEVRAQAEKILAKRQPKAGAAGVERLPSSRE